MDFSQRKLTKQEWEGIEVPVSPEEKEILKMIRNGFTNIGIKYNKNETFMTFSKLDKNDTMEKHIFNTYFKKRIEKIYKKSGLKLMKESSKNELNPKKRDIIRLENVNKSLDRHKGALYEFTILDLIEKMLGKYNKNQDKWMLYYYTLTHLQKCHLKMNIYLQKEVDVLLETFGTKTSISLYLENVEHIIEKNDILLRYTDTELYDHQKRIFNIFGSISQGCVHKPKLVLYVAPTGTGKTLTPIGLSEKFRVIFVCAARHVGLALAKSSISAGRKIALAFNCKDVDDIRLHYAAAKEYTKNYRTGGIFKVDNSVGDNVEIMISDIQSYLIAMRYMKAFNAKGSIITYWDEPTITMDNDEHPYHSMIKQNWCENDIPNIVLSSATLPHDDEIRDVIADYITRFEGEVQTILSSDCSNSIPLISKSGAVTVPHHLCENRDFSAMLSCIQHCRKSSSLIRYMDLKELCKFILFLNNEKYIQDHHYYIEEYFETTKDITIKEIKLYYLSLFEKLDEKHWNTIYEHFQNHRTQPYPSNILVTTKDAYTLTHGPSIYLAKDIRKVGLFYLQQSNIHPSTLDTIDKQVEKNNKINAEVEKLEQHFENSMAKEAMKEKKMSDEGRLPPEIREIRRKIEDLQQQIGIISLPDIYIPNSPEHQFKWAKHANTTHSFIPNIEDEYVIKLMQLSDIEPIWKLLLLMGIGVFMEHKSIGYVEIMKMLAQEQKLLLILATDDYIYGTNYQFCHGYIGKDLIQLTEEKLIQALGRVGRNKQCKDYSVRMRDDSFLSKVFMPIDVKKEAETMNRLFTSE